MFARTKITHVAIRFRGEIYFLPAPNRHEDVIREIVKKTGVTWAEVSRPALPEDDYGFLDEGGHYLRRAQALMSAMLFEQVKDREKHKGNELYSDDIW